MIPDLTPSASERTTLTSVRYAMTVVANITVYVVMWIALGGKDVGLIGPEEAPEFRNVMIVAVSLGFAASIAFHVLVGRTDANEENRINSELDEADSAYDVVRRMTLPDWFKEPQFYLVAGVYMTTRLFINLCQAYIPIYLQITLKLSATFVAVIPLTTYLSGLVTSAAMTTMNRRFGRKVTYLIGALLGVAGCIWIKAGCKLNDDSTEYQVFFVAALVGAGGSTMLVTALALTADLIGRNSESGAFVYGFMSLTDKVSNGVAVVVIQHLIPTDLDTCIECRLYFRDVLFYVCGGSALFGAVFMLGLTPFRIGSRWRDRQSVQAETEAETTAATEAEEPDERTPLIS